MLIQLLENTKFVTAKTPDQVSEVKRSETQNKSSVNWSTSANNSFVSNLIIQTSVRLTSQLTNAAAFVLSVHGKDTLLVIVLLN